MDSMTYIKLIFLRVLLMVAGVIFVVIGISFTIYSVNNLKRLKENGIKTDVVISKMEKRRLPEDTRYKVFTTFVDKNGTEITTELKYSFTSMYVGKEIEIYYDPSNPSKIAIENTLSQYGFLYIFGGVGLLLLIIGFILKLNSSKGVS